MARPRAHITPQKVKDKQQKGEPKLPYPGYKKKLPDPVIYDSFKKALSDLRLEIPFADVVKVPSYEKFLRDILNRKKEITETVAVIDSYPVHGKLVAKSGDPGIPTISCLIGKTEIHNALCDLVAGVSVMPHRSEERRVGKECRL